ncbi:HET-domain-containing protein [Annulohypoxylon truncatum]|uniref:HET-domain-containing protein n=1 Tax=Annulohypoxylon truncatum TaxID=327061 RepID=UPI002008A56D|nr:HET-domain-containing protein [Annulohypoxylon truncatum]KAI1207499.1 HET-domain-containing protein [Annulohypoxylon truncatum]
MFFISNIDRYLPIYLLRHLSRCTSSYYFRSNVIYPTMQTVQMSSCDSNAVLKADDVVFEDAVLETPCNYCKLLEFDDLRQGGRVQVAKDGTPFVSFIESFYGRPIPKLELDLGYCRADFLPDLPGLAETASQGCTFCEILRRDILSVWNKKIQDSLNRGVAESEKIERARLTIIDIEYKLQKDITMNSGEEFESRRPWFDMLVVYFEIDGSKDNIFSLHYNLHTQNYDPSAIWLNIRRRPIPLGSFSTTRFERLKELIHLSLHEHLPPTDDIYLPTRLIDVGTRMSEYIRLVITEQHQPLVQAKDYDSKRYVALSYCWGSGKDAERQLKTTKDILDNHVQGIKAERLPGTVADAVKVCRGIGVRYIWVDALCIIQDDEEDWARESFEMSNIFAKSFLSLCILRGDSCSSRFLTRPDSRTLRINFQSRLDSSVSGSLDLNISQSPTLGLKRWLFLDQLYDFYDIDKINNVAEREIGDATWNSRGWTFQEALLSPRKVYFGNYMFHMSCGKLQESEDGARFKDWTWEMFPFLAKNMDWINPWYKLLDNYCKRRLSYRQDTLPALSALARAYSDSYPGQKYLAGLWDSDIECGLLWVTNASQDPQSYLQQRKDEYIAPSWSWACRPCVPWWLVNVSLRRSFTREFELRKSEIITQEGNSYGRVYGGYLLLHAKIHQHLLNGGVRPNISSPWVEDKFGFGHVLHSNGNEYIAHLQFDHFDWSIDGCKRGRYEYPDWPVDRLFMVLLSRCYSNSDPPFPPVVEGWFGILVIKADDEDGFERVGIFHSKEYSFLGGRELWDGIERQEIKLI